MRHADAENAGYLTRESATKRPAAVTVSVVDHESGPMIVECLRSLFRSTSLSLEVFVIENVPPERKTELEKEFPQITTIHNPAPIGFAANHNKAIVLGTAAYHMVLNDDTIMPPGVIDRLVDFAETHERAGVIGPKLVDVAGTMRERPARFPSLLSEVARAFPARWLPDRFHGYYPAAAHERAFQPDWVTGACLLLRRRALEETGPLDPGYFMYYEEPDLCHRMRRAGWEVWYVPDVHVVHLSAQTVKRHMTNEWRQAHFYASRLRYFRIHHGALAAESLRASVLFVDGLRWLKWFVIWRLSRSEDSRARWRLATAALRSYMTLSR